MATIHECGYLYPCLDVLSVLRVLLLSLGDYIRPSPPNLLLNSKNSHIFCLCRKQMPVSCLLPCALFVGWYVRHLYFPFLSDIVGVSNYRYLPLDNLLSYNGHPYTYYCDLSLPNTAPLKKLRPSSQLLNLSTLESGGLPLPHQGKGATKLTWHYPIFILPSSEREGRMQYFTFTTWWALELIHTTITKEHSHLWTLYLLCLFLYFSEFNNCWLTKMGHRIWTSCIIDPYLSDWLWAVHSPSGNSSSDTERRERLPIQTMLSVDWFQY